MIGLRLLGCCKLCEDSRSWRAFTFYGTLTFFFRWPLFIETGNLLPLPLSSQLRLRGDLRDPRGRVSGGWEDAGQTRQLQPHRWEGASIWLTSDYSFFLEAIPKSYLCYFLNPKTKQMTKPLQTSTFFCSKGFLMMIFFADSQQCTIVFWVTWGRTVIFFMLLSLCLDHNVILCLLSFINSAYHSVSPCV